MTRGDPPVDLDRLSRPDAHTFRHIAEALGARFAGDWCPTTGGTEEHAPTRASEAPVPRAAVGIGARHGGSGSTLEGAVKDARLAEVLDRIPVALLVVSGETVVFLNRTALGQFGYGCAATLRTAGGFGALFDGGRHDSGLMAMVTASGARFWARVTIAGIEWGGKTAMLATILPGPFLPDPDPKGRMNDAGRIPDARPASTADHHRRGTGGDPPDGVLPAFEPQHAAAAPVAIRRWSALTRAARDVRRLVEDTNVAVLILTEGDEAPDEGEGEAEERLLRALLLAGATQAPTGSVLIARRSRQFYELALSCDASTVFRAVLASHEIALAVNASSTALRLCERGRLVVERAPGRLPHNVVRLDVDREPTGRPERSA